MSTETTMPQQELIQFVIEEELNMFYSPNSDWTDMDYIELSPETYLSENLEYVVGLFNAKNR